MTSPVRSVAIIGAGASGSALAFYLGQAGLKVVLFDRKGRPPIAIGESLVPATVPFLRDFGIEDEVRSYSTYKPGATFVFNTEENLSVLFSEVRGATTPYSYNVVRDRLDGSIAEVARKSNARVVRDRARVKAIPGTDRVELSAESLAATEGFLEGQPDLIVDASGRARYFPNLLELPFEAGDRRDVALFAHCEGVAQVVAGNVHTDLLERGWGWRIPLPGKMSVGLVMDPVFIKAFGDDIEEQFDNYLNYDPVIKLWGDRPQRITPVLKYTNYQLVSRRGVGDGWALLGDSFGFVDPVFSSGLLLAFDSAKELARAIVAGGHPSALRRYEAHVASHIRAWQQTIEHFYNGRLLSLLRVGETSKQHLIGRVLDFHFRKHLPRVFTGEASTKRYSVGLVDFMCKHALSGNDPEAFRVR